MEHLKKAILQEDRIISIRDMDKLDLTNVLMIEPEYIKISDKIYKWTQDKWRKTCNGCFLLKENQIDCLSLHIVNFEEGLVMSFCNTHCNSNLKEITDKRELLKIKTSNIKNWEFRFRERIYGR